MAENINTEIYIESKKAGFKEGFLIIYFSINLSYSFIFNSYQFPIGFNGEKIEISCLIFS